MTCLDLHDLHYGVCGHLLVVRGRLVGDFANVARADTAWIQGISKSFDDKLAPWKGRTFVLDCSLEDVRGYCM